MNYSIKVNTSAHDAAHLLRKPDIKQKDDYFCIQYQEENLINADTNTERFWKFYHTAFKLAYQTNAVIRQAFTLLVSIILKETPADIDEEYAECLAF